VLFFWVLLSGLGVVWGCWWLWAFGEWVGVAFGSLSICLCYFWGGGVGVLDVVKRVVVF